MALISCPECGKEMSDTLKKCPHCGMKIKKQKNKEPMGKKTKIIILACAIVILLTIAISVLLVNLFSLTEEEKSQVDKINNHIALVLDTKVDELSKDGLKKCITQCDEGKKMYDEADWKVKFHVQGSGKLDSLKNDCSNSIEKINKDDVAKVEEAIKDIGTVSLESKSKVENAQKMYNELDEEQKKRVKTYDALETSQKMLSEIKVENTTTLISKIGTVKYNKTSKKKIDDAKSAYNELSADEKKLVNNYQTLTKAEKKYDDLESSSKEEEKIKQIKNTISITNCSFEMNSVGGCDIQIYGVNKSKKTIKYIEYQLVAFNDVNDIIENEIGWNDYTTDLQFTGPVKPGATFGQGKYWEAAFYNTTTSYFKITQVVVKYTDGTKIEILIKYIAYICNW